MGLRDKLRGKKSADKAPTAPLGAAEPPFPPAGGGGGGDGGGGAAAVQPVTSRRGAQPKVQPVTAAVRQQRDLNAQNEAKVESETEMMEQIKKLKEKVEDEEKMRGMLEKRKEQAVRELAAIRALPHLNKPKHDRAAREMKRAKDAIEDSETRIKKFEETAAAMEQKLRQRRDYDDFTGVQSAFKKVTVDADKVERQMEEIQDHLAETDNVRTIVNQMARENDDDLEDDIEQELALLNQQDEIEREAADRAAAEAARPAALAALANAEATPTSAPGPLAATVAPRVVDEEEEALKRLEQQIAM